MTTEELRVRLAMSSEETLDAIERAAEFWDAGWRRHGVGGRLELPVVAGLRRGMITAQLSTVAEGDGTALTIQVESSHYKLQTASVSLLAMGGLGGLALTVWPLYPPILALAPVALILLVVAWLVVGSRLQNSGIEEFLDLVRSSEPNAEVETERKTESSNGPS